MNNKYIFFRTWSMEDWQFENKSEAYIWKLDFESVGIAV